MSFWDIFQQVQIENLKARQTSGESNVERVESRYRALGADLNNRVETLALVTEAMWELLSERSGLTADELATRVREIDARDGEVDGRRGVAAGSVPTRCPSCQAAMRIGRSTCQFCGAIVPDVKGDPFKV